MKPFGFLSYKLLLLWKAHTCLCLCFYCVVVGVGFLVLIQVERYLEC